MRCNASTSNVPAVVEIGPNPVIPNKGGSNGSTVVELKVGLDDSQIKHLQSSLTLMTLSHWCHVARPGLMDHRSLLHHQTQASTRRQQAGHFGQTITQKGAFKSCFTRARDP